MNITKKERDLLNETGSLYFDDFVEEKKETYTLDELVEIYKCIFKTI